MPIYITFYNDDDDYYNSFDELINLPNYNDIRIIFSDNNVFKPTVLPKLPERLEELNYTDNALEKLPELPNTLKLLSCGHNKLTELPELPDGLLEFSCTNQSLKLPDKLPENLEYFAFIGTNIEELPELPNSITKLYCGLNKLKKLPTLPKNLKVLMCQMNNLGKLPILPNTLEKLCCGGNNLSSLPNIPISLKFLYIADYDYSHNSNSIRTLPIYMHDIKIHMGCMPIIDYIDKYFNYKMANYIEFNRKTFKKFVDKIGSWYLECKYNPIYKQCRKKIKMEYEELYN